MNKCFPLPALPKTLFTVYMFTLLLCGQALAQGWQQIYPDGQGISTKVTYLGNSYRLTGQNSSLPQTQQITFVTINTNLQGNQTGSNTIDFNNAQMKGIFQANYGNSFQTWISATNKVKLQKWQPGGILLFEGEYDVPNAQVLTSPKLVEATDGSIFLAGVNTENSATPYFHYYVIKLASSGNLLWSKNLLPGNGLYNGQPSNFFNGQITNMATTLEGGLCFAGSAGAPDSRFLVRMDANGNATINKWSAWCVVNPRVIVDGLNGVTALATLNSSTGPTDTPGWIYTFNGDGTSKWSVNLNGLLFDQPLPIIKYVLVGAVTTAADGGFVIAGTRSAAGVPLSFFMMKLDADGNTVWANYSYGFDASPSSIAILPTGGYLVSGVKNGETWLAKTDETGNINVTPPTTCAGNLLSNPGFESCPTGTASCFSDYSVQGSVYAGPDPHSGSNGAILGNSFASVGQTEPTSPGTSYTAKVWAKTAGSSNNSLQLRFLTSSWQTLPGQTQQTITSIDYQEYTLSGTAPTGAAFVYLMAMKDGSGSVVVDDWCLTEGSGGTTCSLTVDVGPSICDDNGTPNFAGDDSFTATVTVTNPGGGTGFVPVTPPGCLIDAGNYGTTYTFGPANILGFGNDCSVATIIDNEEPTCQTTYSISPSPTCSKGGGSGDIDLSLTLQQMTANPAQWNNYPVKLTVNNAGPQTATSVKVKFAKPNGVVYVGGNEFTASQGSFNPNGDEVWTVGSIPANGSATLTVNYFLLNASAPVAYAEVSAANELDVDSTPNNGTPPSINEDDEASTDSSVSNGLTLTCPADLTTEAFPGNPNVPLSGTAPLLFPDATTDCTTGDATVSFDGFDVLSGNIAVLYPGGMIGQHAISGFGVIKLYFVATDNCGNTEYCDYTLTRNELTPYVEFTNCPDVLEVAVPNGATSAQVDLPSLAAVEFCPNNDGPVLNPIVQVVGPPSGSTFPLGTTEVGFEVVSCYGMEAICFYNVIVSEAPLGNLPDLILADLQIPTATVATGAVMSYNFDASNAGTAAVPGNFTIKSYISTDQTLSANDIQDGTIQTGNFGAGQVQNDVPGASTIPANLAAGQYFLIVKIDADDAIAEGNENNNVVVKPFTVTGVGNTSCSAVTITSGPGQITIAGASAPHVLIKIFRPNWTVAFECLDNCPSPVVVDGLTAGPHYIQVKLIDQGWGEICYLEQTVDLTSFGGSGGTSLKTRNSRQRMAFDNIYPNPAKYMVTLEIYSKDKQSSVLDFYNQQGQSVHRMEVDLAVGRNEVELDVSQWKSGAYNVIGRGNGHPAYGRFLKVWED